LLDIGYGFYKYHQKERSGLLAEFELTLIQKLAKIRAMSDVVSKEKRGYNYSYADITTILAKITAGMKKYNVSLIPSITPGTVSVEQHLYENTKFSKTGESYVNKSTEMVVQADMVYKWVNDDDPDDFIEVPWFLVGAQSDPSQAFGSGLTYTLRQFLTSYFQIAQADSDVDAYRTKQKTAEVAEEREVAKAIIAEFDKIIKMYLADNPDKSDEVKKFISRYAKGGNYLVIKEPALASKLLEDFKNAYLNGGATV
jgi:ABC-type Fe3+-hydroxamate transport system substrate-binding protein